MNSQIDESLYSRQLYVIGKDAMERMMKSSILVIGLDGLGQEVVKNLCLTGVSRIFICDNSEIKEHDLSTGFYFTRKDIGKKKSEVLLERFRNLNEYVSVNIVYDFVSFKEFDLVISCNEQVHSMIKINKQARRDNCKYIGCQSRGVFSQIFCDFGSDFICVDTNGEPPIIGMINDISSTGILTVVDEQRHNLEDGDIVKIIQNTKNQEKKMYEGILFKVKGLNKSQIQLTKIDGSTILDSEFANLKEMPFEFTEIYGGDFEQIKRPKIIHFKMLEDLLDNPNILSYNFEADAQNLVSHRCFIALSEYQEKHHCFPNEDQFLSFYIKRFNNQGNLVKIFGRQSDTQFMPMCSIVGGFVAQEALKGISYKFTPLVQFMYYDAYELCNNFDLSEKNYGRYQSMYKIFGEENLQKLFNMRLFLVGAGAIGCEHLKNIVMCGISSQGKLNVTDMDSIEQSNLNRQFLFSKLDVEKMKAEVAVSKIPTLNEDFTYSENIRHFNLKVGEETEEIFSDDFFEDNDVVLNALDNVEARLYTDERCVLHRKPLVDSGTSGTKGNVQVIIPLFSESYGSSRDPPEKSIPLCTIKNFPHAIEHTIEWAMSEFRLRFHDQILKIMDSEDAEDDDVSELIRISPNGIEDCVRLGLRLFIKYFHTSIQELLKTFPPDSLTKEGQPFWMPPKRAPEPINFNLENDLHITFIRSVANIYKDIFNIEGNIIQNIYVKDFIHNELENIDNLSLNQDKKVKENFENLVPQEFEKDNDLNSHVDFVFSCANLRAQNYQIKNLDRLAIKGIAGRIIPAIATTTAVVSGLSIIEMIKLHLKYDNTKFKNSFLNLALPYFGTSDPIEAEKQFYFLDDKKYFYNMWNRLEYKNTKLKNIIKAFEIQFKVKVSMLTIDNKLLYWDVDDKYESNMEKKIDELVEQIKGRKLVQIDLATDSEVDNYPRIIVLLDK
ncbi:ubiquitin-activating enzyme E1 1 (UBA1) [Vairimorpha necatrix]|uniref:Ubiquitin-activating enzyme E1 1 (UBA1) n=1 Tax=Vairimorpha necatrix TaxID=6039 RepID=A0AAX4JG80_9MICR